MSAPRSVTRYRDGRVRVVGGERDEPRLVRLVLEIIAANIANLEWRQATREEKVAHIRWYVRETWAANDPDPVYTGD